MTKDCLDKFNELLDHLNDKISKRPWRMEQDERSGEFAIFDADFRLVADAIPYEDDAIFIVNLVNLLQEK